MKERYTSSGSHWMERTWRSTAAAVVRCNSSSERLQKISAAQRSLSAMHFNQLYKWLYKLGLKTSLKTSLRLW